ncbi:GNAT family N-acetyltransferase [Sphingomicrobium nitratireducens]|uniref:GNAT family N-acetyltransferase n=1 Tax=Sphingomicrobium nitratireducens TaxID=2964666 RepID=UPI00223EEC98|nr:GNAT family N-acetyltransferase [Sphingomicrobium nitratireducens]
MDIRFEERGDRGRWYANVEGSEREAEMTYSRSGENTIMIDHTFVPDEARGHGVGAELAENAIAHARREGWKVIPVCPFVKALADSHEAWSDVIAD